MRDGGEMAPADGRPPMDEAAFKRRQRMRNIALFVVLLALVVLFYAMTIAKLTKGVS
jgi:hypothetical protein